MRRASAEAYGRPSEAGMSFVCLRGREASVMGGVGTGQDARTEEGGVDTQP